MAEEKPLTERVGILEDWRDTVEKDVKLIPVMHDNLKSLKTTLGRLAWILVTPVVAYVITRILEVAKAQ